MIGAGKERKPKRTLRSNLARTITDYTLTVIWGITFGEKLSVGRNCMKLPFPPNLPNIITPKP